MENFEVNKVYYMGGAEQAPGLSCLRHSDKTHTRLVRISLNPATDYGPNPASHFTPKSVTFNSSPILLDLNNYLYKSKFIMRVVTYSEARSSLKSVLDQVNEDADVTIISRRDGADAVVMSLDQYQSIMETMHLLSTPANAAALAKGIAQDRKGQAKRRELVAA